MSSHVDIATVSHDYGEPKSHKAKVSPNVPQPLHNERLVVDPTPQMSEVSAKHLTINPNSKATQRYSIFEYLA